MEIRMYECGFGDCFRSVSYTHLPGKLVPDAVIVAIRFRDIDWMAAAGMGTGIDKGKLEREGTVKVGKK